MILIEKKANRTAMMRNFRPIGLLEVMRKVWTKMVTQGILPPSRLTRFFSRISLPSFQARAPPVSSFSSFMY
jgi:hypothetical protein